MAEEIKFSIPQFIKDKIRDMGYSTPGTAMESYIQTWDNMFRADGIFWYYDDRDSAGRVYKVHRRTVKPAKRVCDEWSSLILSDDTSVACGKQKCTNWLADYFNRINFYGNGQDIVTRAFALGTGAWAMWADLDAKRTQIRRYDARMVVPLSWDDDGITECAFVTKARIAGQDYSQLQMHLIDGGRYSIFTFCFDDKGKEVFPEGLLTELKTQCETPTFAVIKPAVANTCVDNSPYGMSVFDDAIDALKSVDEAYDAIFNEINLGKMRVFMDDMLFDVKRGEKCERQPIPFGKDDLTIFRKVSGMGDAASKGIVEFAPSLRIADMKDAYRTALQTMGDKCGFGLNYFDIDDSGGIKTATEVSADNSALMRNIKRHERLMQGSIAQIARAAIHFAREFQGVSMPDPGEITVTFDDSIITDTAAEKQQDMAEVNITMNPWEYRKKWYGEDEATAKANVPRGYVEQFEYGEGETGE